MSSYKQIYYQIIFGTKNRKPTIKAANRIELYKYIAGILTNKKCKPYKINGIEDHIHIFCDLHPTVSLSDLIKEVKISTSKWMKLNGKFPEFQGWQEGYGAFTYNHRDRDMIINYIAKQEEHHKKVQFQTEYNKILNDNAITPNEYDTITNPEGMQYP